MFPGFFYALKRAQVPVTLREYLTLMEAMAAGVPEYGIERFYYLARACLVKDERHLDPVRPRFRRDLQGHRTHWRGDGIADRRDPRRVG